jgi:hypothetical protein
MTARKPRSTSRSRRFGPLEVGQVNEQAITTARQLARQPGRRMVVLDQRTVLIANSQ